MADADIKPGDGAPTVEELSKQIENLNKGIASYRDKATTAETTAQAALKQAADAKAEADELKASKEKDSKKGEEKVNLNPDDEKRLEAWAKAHGFVTKEELEVEKSRMFNESLKNVESQAIDEFMKSHPEYDSTDEWDKVKAQFVLYKQPTSITGYRSLLAKIHKELKGSDEAAAKARAAEENRKRLGLGGGSQGGADTDMTLEKLQDKYPSLSREQIVARLEEIKTITSEREARQKK